MHTQSTKPKKQISFLLFVLLVLFSAYAAGGQNGERLRGDRVQCARLVYAGNKTAQCFSDQFLARLAAETRIQAEPHFRPVRLDSRDISSYPFAVMSGEGAFTLTPKERTNLRYYLTHGGFLLASAGCSDAEWTRSFRREWHLLFPGQPLTKISRDHPLFRMVYRIDSLATTHGAIGGEAVLEAFTSKGRIAAIFSGDGLNDTTHTPACCCCGGDEIERAEFINVNVLAYALLH